VSADREPTAAEVLEWRRDDVFLPEAQQPLRSFRLCVTSRPDSSSALWSARSEGAPEYVTLSMCRIEDDFSSHWSSMKATRSCGCESRRK
jgi:hypothetical protein